MNKKYIVYTHINNVNGKIYIGQTCQTLLQRSGLYGQWYKRCPKFGRAIEKYGWENFTHTIVCEDLTKDMADIIEEQLILKYDSINNGYNLTSGGTSGFKLSVETKSKIKITKMGKNNPMYGKRHPKEIQDKINASKKGKLDIKVINTITNKIFDSLTIATNETSDCISTISRHCNNTKVSNRHWMFYDEYLKTSKEDILGMMKQKLSAAKKVINLETLIIYDSMISASKLTYTENSLITRHCKKKVKDPLWMLYDEYIKLYVNNQIK